MKYNAVFFDFGGTIGASDGIPKFVQELIRNHDKEAILDNGGRGREILQVTLAVKGMKESLWNAQDDWLR
jgi:hypothetical protein